jgi:hypothetical protein
MTSRLARLERIANGGETDRVECKSQLDYRNADGRARLVKMLIGLANAHSGTTYLVLGVDDQGSPTGHNHSGLSEERLQQVVQQLCEPYLPTSLAHIELDGKPVCVIETRPRREDLPYRAAQTAGRGPVLKREVIYYRYGRHTTEALYPEINRLIRTPRPRGRQAPDDYRYMSPEQRLEAMIRDLRAAFRASGFTPRDKVYLLPFEYQGVKRTWLRRTYPTVRMSVGGREITMPIVLEPIPLRANFLAWRPMRAMAFRGPTGREQLQLLVAHGSVGPPLSPARRGTIIEGLDFGWYVGPTEKAPREMDGLLVFENARTRSGMGQIVASVIEWLEGPGQEVMLLTDRPSDSR